MPIPATNPLDKPLLCGMPSVKEIIMAYQLSVKDKEELRKMDSDSLATIVPLFAKMNAHPFQITDQPGRLGAISEEAAIILGERQ